MKLLDKKRRQRHADSMNWQLASAMMVMGNELLWAKASGVPEEQKSDRAMEIRDRVLEHVDMDEIVQAFIDADFERLEGEDMDAVGRRALRVSGYMLARGELFPDS